MITSRKIRITALMLWTIAVTVIRTWRYPNDFAEAHWLLDYRFGFVKRALVGEILSLVSGFLSLQITEKIISAFSTISFLIFCITIIIISIRIIHKSTWSAGAILVSLVFLSSPYVVMSAHLNGYYDNIIIVLGVLSIGLLLKGSPWFAACLQILAVLVHESSILVIYPLFCMSWFLINRKQKQTTLIFSSLIPLFLPMLVFIIAVISQFLFLTPRFVELFTSRLSQYPFIQENRTTLVPVWISTSLFDYFKMQKTYIIYRLFSPLMYGFILPTILSTAFFTLKAFRIRDHSIEFICLLGVYSAPQMMHIVAWDTTRIWTYSIISAFLLLWIYSETVDSLQSTPAIMLLCLFSLVVNAIVLTPLMDNKIENIILSTRILLYLPVLIYSMILFLGFRKSSIKE